MAKLLHDEQFDLMEGEAMRRPQQVAYNRTLTYADFRASMYWTYVRELVYRNCRHRYHCTLCNRRDLPVDIHHRTYEHYGDELNHLDDLTLLCRECHKRIHARWKVKAELPQKEELPGGCQACNLSGYIYTPADSRTGVKEAIDYCFCAKGVRRKQLAEAKKQEASARISA